MATGVIEQLITSHARVRVLGQLLLHPDEEYYGAQLERLLGLQPRSVHRELKLLAEAGIITSRQVGRTIVYRANRKCPIFPELHGMLLKTIGLGQSLARHLAEAEGIKWAFIYGSAARAEESASSDIDIMIIGSPDTDELEEALGQAERQIGRPINHSVFSEDEIRERLAADDTFVRGVLAGARIVLVGDDSELRRLEGDLRTPAI